MSDKKREKDSGLYMHVLLCIYAYISCFIDVMSFITYLYIFIDHAYVKGELLGSLSLIDAYILSLIHI